MTSFDLKVEPAFFVRVRNYTTQTGGKALLFPTPASDFMGIAHRKADLDFILRSCANPVIYKGPMAQARVFSYTEAVSRFNETRMDRVKQKLGITRRYYELVWPSGVTQMTVRQFNTWKAIQSCDFEEGLDTFFYVSGSGPKLAVATANVTQLVPTGSTTLIRIRCVLYRGPQATLVAGTQVDANRESLFVPL